MVTEKPLQPLTYGNVLIVGAKVSNLDREILANPRVVLWDSQDERWINKAIPINVRAIFISRWIGHAAFDAILSEARKKKITLFNTQGTGQIMKQVRELLSTAPVSVSEAEPPNRVYQPEPETVTVTEPVPEEERVVRKHQHNKLKPLLEFIDWDKNNAENARVLMEKCGELGITSTTRSLEEFCKRQRILHHQPRPERSVAYRPTPGEKDVTLEMFDNLIKEMRDMRELLSATMKENRELRNKMAALKKFMGVGID